MMTCPVLAFLLIMHDKPHWGYFVFMSVVAFCISFHSSNDEDES